MKKYAVGIVVKDRLDLTIRTLMSLLYTSQNKSSYDVFIINNGSNQETSNYLNAFVTNQLLPIKNLINCPEMSVSKVWNLFLLLSQDYEYRLKLDNDIVFQNTISSKPIGKGSWYKQKTEADKKAELIPTPMTVGPHGHKRKKRDDNITTSCFLDLMSDFCLQNNTDMVSLVPVSPGVPFSTMLMEVSSRKTNGRNYLFGACMLISKKCFDMLGYFDERLPRQIDVEYSQRALRNAMNIGYLPNYYAIHIGASGSTEAVDILEAKQTESFKLRREFAYERYCPTIWQSRPDRFLIFAKKHQVLNIID